jgi:hypothetical protein
MHCPTFGLSAVRDSWRLFLLISPVFVSMRAEKSPAGGGGEINNSKARKYRAEADWVCKSTRWAPAIQTRFRKELIMKVAQMRLLVAVAVILLFRGAAFGGTILSSPIVTSGPGLGIASVPAVITVQANNDNVPADNRLDNNLVVPFKRFDHDDFIDIQFTVAPSEGFTEYQVSEFVDNNTGLPWTSYKMQLGFTVGGVFTPSIANDGLDFDAPNYDTLPNSGAFSTFATPDEDQLVFSGGLHGAGAQPYNFRIDVPDLIGRQVQTFTLRQTPVSAPIPEPSTFVLATIAAIGLMRRRRGD